MIITFIKHNKTTGKTTQETIKVKKFKNYTAVYTDTLDIPNTTISETKIQDPEGHLLYHFRVQYWRDNLKRKEQKEYFPTKDLSKRKIEDILEVAELVADDVYLC